MFIAKGCDPTQAEISLLPVQQRRSSSLERTRTTPMDSPRDSSHARVPVGRRTSVWRVGAPPKRPDDENSVPHFADPRNSPQVVAACTATPHVHCGLKTNDGLVAIRSEPPTGYQSIWDLPTSTMIKYNPFNGFADSKNSPAGP